jgi:hypothetical protein
MLAVVGHLNLATPARLVDAALHRSRDAIGIEDRPTGDVTCRATNGLDERSVAPQKSFLVGIENGDE